MTTSVCPAQRDLPGLKIELEPDLELLVLGRSAEERAVVARRLFRWSKQLYLWLDVNAPHALAAPRASTARGRYWPPRGVSRRPVSKSSGRPVRVIRSPIPLGLENPS